MRSGYINIMKIESNKLFERILKKLGLVKIEKALVYNATIYGVIYIDNDTGAMLQNCNLFPYTDYFTDINSLKGHMKDCRKRLKELNQKPKKVFEYQDILDDIWEQRKVIKK